MSDRLMTLKDVVNKVSMQKSNIYKLMKEGAFPPNYRIGHQGRRWKESMIDEWIASLPVADQSEYHSPNAEG